MEETCIADDVASTLHERIDQRSWRRGRSGGSRRLLILFARECFVEECDEPLNVELNESKIEELDLCLIHFKKVIEFEIDLKERPCFL